MIDRARQLLSEVLALSPEDRAEIASEIIDSLDLPPDGGVERAWVEEIQRRLKLLEEDPSRGLDWEDVKADIEGKFATWERES